MKLKRLPALALLLTACLAAAENGPKLRDAGSLGGIRLAGSEDPGLRKVYIVQLALPSAAEHHAKLQKVVTKPGAGKLPRTRFDKTSPAVQTYAARLYEQQNKVLQRLAPDTELLYR